MKPDRAWKHFGLALVLAVAGYAVLYLGIERLRDRRGPWRVQFTRSDAGWPAIVVNQPRLGITNVQVVFSGESYPANPAAEASATNAPTPDLTASPPAPRSSEVTVMEFAQARAVPFAVPFGECVFLDTTFLPGTVTLRLFHHDVELLPRTLLIDHQKHSWRPDAVIMLPHGAEHPRPPKP